MKDYNIDPELLPILELLPEFSFADPVSAREGMRAMTRALVKDMDTSGMTISEHQVTGNGNAVKVRLYRAEGNTESCPALVYIHGGGFAVGDLDSEHAGAVALCRDLRITLISVDYRLAPEYPYPAGLEDCYSALCWTAANASELDIDSNRIGVIGASAGGGLAAGLALLCKERGGPALCFQFLAIPELDDRLQTASMQAFDDTPMWNLPNAILSWQFYLGENYTSGAAGVPITAAPARASVDQLKGLPPACVTTMEFDPLRDEGLDYAQKLLQAGVSVELHSYPGTFHGSSLVAGAAVSRREQADTRAVLRRALQLTTPEGSR